MPTRIVNPFARWGVSQGWHSKHRAVDYATPFGTVFTAPASGIYEHLGGSLGYSAYPSNPGLYGQIRLPDGRRIIVCHLSRHIAPHGTRVTVGLTELAATGNSGHVVPRPTAAAPYNGSHMHTYGLTAKGERWDWTRDAVPAGGSASGDAKPLPPQEEDDMFTDADRALLSALVGDRAPSGGVQVYERVGAGPQEFMVVAPTEYGPLAADPKQDGYRVTLDGDEARVWARQYSGADKVPTHVTRDEYIAAQVWARARAADYRETQKALLREVLAERASSTDSSG